MSSFDPEEATRPGLDARVGSRLISKGPEGKLKKKGSSSTLDSELIAATIAC